MYIRLSLLILSLFTTTTISFSQDYEKANSLIEAGKYKEAAVEYEKVIPWLIEELGDNDTTGLPTYYYLLGSSYYFSGQTDKAIETHYKNHDLCTKNIKGISQAHLNSLIQLCQIANDLADRDGILILRNEIVSIRKSDMINKDNLLELGYAYNDLGLANYNLGNDSTAILNYQEAINILTPILGSEHIDIANILANQSNSFIYAKQYEKAKTTYQLAFEIVYKIVPQKYTENLRSMKDLSKELVGFNLYEESKHALYIDIDTKKKFISKTDTSLLEVYSDLAHTFYYLNDFKKGELTLDSCSVITNQNFKPDTYDWAFWHGYIGDNYNLLKNLDKAISSSNLAFSYYEKNIEENTYAYLIVNNTLLHFHLLNEDFQSALKHSQIKIEHYKKDLNNKDNFNYYIPAVQEKAEIHTNLLQHRESIETLSDALKNTEKYLGKDIVYINLLDLLGKNYQNSSNFPKAIEVTDERVALLEEKFTKNSSEYAIGLNDLGLVYLSAGEYIKALEAFENAYVFLETTQYLNKVNTLNNIARCYTELANFTKALKHYNESIKTHRENDTTNVHYCAALINIAVMYSTMKDFENAEKYYIEAKDVILALEGKENQYYVTIQNSLGNLYMNTQRYDESLLAYSESMELLEKVYGKHDPIVTQMVGNFGHALCVFQKYDDGINLLELVRKRLINVAGKQNPLSMLNAVNLGSAYHANDQDQKAYEMFTDQFETINNNVNYNLKYLGEGESIEYLKSINLYYSICYSYLLDTYEKHQDLADVGLNSLLQIKGKLLHSNTALKNQILNSKNKNLIETYSNWLLKIQAISAIQSMANIDMKLLDKTKEEAEALEKLLINGSKDFAESLNQKYDWKDIQKTISEDETVIEFVAFNHQQKFTSDTIRFGAFIFNKQSEHPLFINVCTKKKLIDIIGEYGGNNLSYIQNIYGKSGEKSKLYDILWKPLLEHIPTGSKVIISPDDLLHKISFSGISDGSKFMNQKYSIKLVNATTSLLKRESSLSKLDPVILGGIDYDYQVDSDADHIWTFLEGTKVESKEIEQKFITKGINPSYLSAGDANESTLSEILPTKNIAHIATHGFFYPKPSLAEEIIDSEIITDEDVVFRGGSRGLGYNFYVTNKNPMMRSGIALSGANQVWNKTDISLNNDGVLTAQDIAVMDLRKLDIMVLSACETGLGDIEGSEGVYGLQRSLKMAGVQNIIMSLWQVPDKETKEFMILFYDNLLETKNVRESFHEAQLQMSQKYDAFYWAAFVLI
jgi:CHAT domain-containing protein